MDSNMADKRDFEGNLQLAEPHFDEEATLLSAQPVVPLDRVKHERRLGRRMSFGIAIVSSLVLGALAARLIYRSGGEAQSPTSVSDVARDGAGLGGAVAPAPSSNAEAATGSAQVSQSAISADAQTTSEASVKEKPAKKEVSGRKPAPQSQTAGAARLERHFADEHERTRERRKEARGHQNKPPDGLLRIREIFEGPARP